MFSPASSHNKQKSPNSLEEKVCERANMHLIHPRSHVVLRDALLRLVFITLTLSVCVATAAFSDTGATSQYLHLTALISDHNGRAFFECWEIASPFSRYPTVGEAIPDLADVSNVSYVVLPPRSNEGLHKPPHPMFVLLINNSSSLIWDMD